MQGNWIIQNKRGSLICQMINYLGSWDHIGIEVDRLVLANLATKLQYFIVRRFAVSFFCAREIISIYIRFLAAFEVNSNLVNVLPWFYRLRSSLLGFALEAVYNCNCLLAEVQAKLERCGLDHAPVSGWNLIATLGLWVIIQPCCKLWWFHTVE